MFLADHALRLHAEIAFEQRLGKALPPHLALQIARDVQREFARIERAIGSDGFHQRIGIEQFLRNSFEREPKIIEVFFADAQARRHRVAAEFLDQMRLAFGDQIERIAQMQPGDAASRAFEFPVCERAKAITGRWNLSFRREARMPITP